MPVNTPKSFIGKERTGSSCKLIVIKSLLIEIFQELDGFLFQMRQEFCI